MLALVLAGSCALICGGLGGCHQGWQGKDALINEPLSGETEQRMALVGQASLLMKTHAPQQPPSRGDLNVRVVEPLDD